MTVTLEPPASLPRDEARGVFVALVLPWDEPADRSHDSEPGRVYRFGEVHQPRDKASCRVSFDHEVDQVGSVVATASDQVGLWCSVKLGRLARQQLARGRCAVSAEIDDSGTLSGLALVTSAFNVPGFPSARVVVPDGFTWPPLRAHNGAWSGVGVSEVGRSPSWLVLNGDRPPVTPEVSVRGLVVDAGRVRREVAAASFAAVDEDVEYHRARFEERRAAFAAAEVQHEEDLLRAAMVPMSLWPPHTTGRRQWDTLVATQEADREAERRRTEAAGIAALQASWREREAVQVEERKASWLSRMRRRLSFRRSALSVSTIAAR